MPGQLLAQQRLIVVAGVVVVDAFLPLAGFFDAAVNAAARTPRARAGAEPAAVSQAVGAAEELQVPKDAPRDLVGAKG